MQRGTGVALVFENEALSYGELEGRTAVLAAKLLGFGCGGSVVGLCVKKGVEAISGKAGIMRSGSAYVPLDPDLPQERLGFIVTQCVGQVVAAQRRFVERVNAFKLTIVTIEHTHATGNANQMISNTAQGALVYVLFTSGSTGKPKGVTFAHQSLANYLIFAITEIGLCYSDAVLYSTAFTFDVSVQLVWYSLVSG